MARPTSSFFGGARIGHIFAQRVLPRDAEDDLKTSAAILISLGAALLTSHPGLSATNGPLIEFTYTDGPSTQDSSPDVQPCGYYLLIRGTITHSGGYRPGASVHLLGDTLAAAVSLYRASVFDPRDARQASWTLRIGALDRKAYHVTVAVGGTVLVRREVRLIGQESCST